MEILTCDRTPGYRQDSSVECPVPRPSLITTQAAESEGKAKVTSTSLGLSRNDLMFPLLRRVMKTSISGAQGYSLILLKINPGLISRDNISIEINYMVT